jgi:hypothetical protein
MARKKERGYKAQPLPLPTLGNVHERGSRGAALDIMKAASGWRPRLIRPAAVIVAPAAGSPWTSKASQGLILDRAARFVAKLQAELAEAARCQAVAASIIGELAAEGSRRKGSMS